MIGINSTQKFIKAFALRDALFRAVSLIGSTFTIAAISLLPGFGVKGLLIATSIQLVLSALLELPTSIAADRFGRSLILRISLFLKLFVSISLGFAIYFASRGEVQLVWYAFFVEALLDAVSNTLLSGSYQVSYLSLYESLEKNNLSEKPPLFLKCFEHGFKFRILFPILFVFLILVMFKFYETSHSNLYHCAYLILGLIILARTALFIIINSDFKKIDPLTDKAKSGLIKGLREIIIIISTKKTLFLTYSLTALFNFIGIFFLTGQSIKVLKLIEFKAEFTWMAAIATSILIYLLRTFTSIWLLPKISKDFIYIIMPIFGFLVFLGGVSLTGFEIYFENNFINYFFLIILTSTLFIVSDALGKSIESSLKTLIQAEYKTTWLSLGNTLAYLTFGCISVIISKYYFDYANLIIGVLLALCGLFVLISQLLLNQKNTNITFLEVLRSQLTKILLVIIFVIVAIDVTSYTFLTHNKISETRLKTANTVLLGIKSSIIQGDIIETSNFLYSLKSGNFIRCFDLDVLNTLINDCELNSAVKGNDFDSIDIKYDGNSYGKVKLYFDLNPLRNDLYIRIVLDIIISFFLYAILYYIFILISKAVTTEVKHLHLSIDESDREKNSSQFKIREFKEISEHLFEIIKLKESLQFQSAFVNVASQVSHDIRSPLSALGLVMNQLHQIPEDKRIIIRSSVNRINDIANELLEKSKLLNKISSLTKTLTNLPTKRILSPHLLSPLVDSIVSEKRIQFRDKQHIEIEANIAMAYGLFVNINAVEMKRCLSNIITNAVEALPENLGKVTVEIQSTGDQVVISTQDNGRGMPKHMLQKLGEMGVTHGKEGTHSGSGLGIYYAKKMTEDAGGKFEIQSQESIGTKVIMSFNKAESPYWFVERLSLAPGLLIISLDDDLSIHQIWKDRFESKMISNFDIKHTTFTSGEDFKSHVLSMNNISKSKCLYLVDYELINQKFTGLDIIEELEIESQSILVTSRYEEVYIRERCEKLGVKLIPKAMAGFVPIELESAVPLFDCILIDDDPLIRMTWELAAKDYGTSILTFDTYESFCLNVQKISKQTPIYVDVNLSNGVLGTNITIKLENMGYKKIYLATGYEPDQISNIPSCVIAVCGKDPFFKQSSKINSYNFSYEVLT